MTVLRFPSPRSARTAARSAAQTAVSPNHPSLGLIWGQLSSGQLVDPNPPVSSISSITSISCGDCTMADTSACDDCVISLLSEGPPFERRIDLDASEANTLELFSRAGITPSVRHTCDRITNIR
jgi:hypothetical protein